MNIRLKISTKQKKLLTELLDVSLNAFDVELVYHRPNVFGEQNGELVIQGRTKAANAFDSLSLNHLLLKLQEMGLVSEAIKTLWYGQYQGKEQIWCVTSLSTRKKE